MSSSSGRAIAPRTASGVILWKATRRPDLPAPVGENRACSVARLRLIGLAIEFRFVEGCVVSERLGLDQPTKHEGKSLAVAARDGKGIHVDGQYRTMGRAHGYPKTDSGVTLRERSAQKTQPGTLRAFQRGESPMTSRVLAVTAIVLGLAACSGVGTVLNDTAKEQRQAILDVIQAARSATGALGDDATDADISAAHDLIQADVTVDAAWVPSAAKVWRLAELKSRRTDAGVSQHERDRVRSTAVGRQRLPRIGRMVETNV